MCKQSRRNKLFHNGMHKLSQETDIISIIKAVRMSKLYLKTITHKNQRLLFNLQRSSVLSTSSNEEKRENSNSLFKWDMNTLESVFELGKAHRLLRKFSGVRVSKLDKRLIKGFYVGDPTDSEVDE